MRLIGLLTILLLATAVLAEPGAIEKRQLDKYYNDAVKDMNRFGKVITNAVTNNDLLSLSLNREKLLTHDEHFTFKLKSAGVTNQASSGRCWIFAGMNVFAPNVTTKLQLSEFEFSQAYMAFYDKLEKSNYFLEEMIRLRDKPTTSREMEIHITSPIGDGGWWNYATSLIEKYGAVPKTAMPETKQSSKTGQLNKLINQKLRIFAIRLRTLHQNGKSVADLRKEKEEMLKEIYRILTYHYGVPPSEFEFKFKQSDTTDLEIESFTPSTFREKYIGNEMPEYVALLNDPGKKYNQTFEFEGSRNMYETKDMVVLNLPIEKLKNYSMQSLYDSQVVWFACDVGKEHYRDSAIFMTDIYKYDLIMQVDLSISKADRLAFLDATPNHAMVFMGVDTTSDGTPSKWLVENSWGKKRGDKGFWYMYDDWFTEYVFIVIVDKRLLSPEDLASLEKEPIKMPMWAPIAKALR